MPHAPKDWSSRLVTEAATTGTARRRDRRRPRGRGPRSDEASEGPELIERSVKIRRVSKVVKGGRNLSFSALMVIGDGAGRVGAALGRAASVPDAVRKGRQRAESDMHEIVLNGNTIPHEVTAKFGGAKVTLLPAAPGTGVIAGGGIRAVVEAVGIADVLSKNHGSRNAVNTVRATIKALRTLRDPRAERARRLGYVAGEDPGPPDISMDISETEAVPAGEAEQPTAEAAITPETDEAQPPETEA